MNIASLFSGVASGYANRAFEERARKEREDVRKQNKEGSLTDVEKLRLGSLQNMFNDPTIDKAIRIRSWQEYNNALGIGIKDNPNTANIDESGVSGAVDTKMDKEKQIFDTAEEERKFNRTQRETRNQLDFLNIEIKKKQLDIDEAKLKNTKDLPALEKAKQLMLDKQVIIASISAKEKERNQFKKADLDGKLVFDTEHPEYIRLTNEIKVHLYDLDQLSTAGKGNKNTSKQTIPGFGS